MDNKQEMLDLARKRGLYPGSKKVRAFWLFGQGYRPCDIVAGDLVDLTPYTVYHYHYLWNNGLKY
ncbi:hypothetical protein ACFLTS_05925 [Chloroflexota bacterium]